MNKEQLLNHLKTEVYCRLVASPIHGVGVQAIRTIPAGIDPLKIQDEEISFAHSELADVDPAVMNILQAYCYQDDEHIYVPHSGLNRIAILRCLNHSSEPNVELDPEQATITTLRQIEPGEELVFDYEKSYGFLD